MGFSGTPFMGQTSASDANKKLSADLDQAQDKAAVIDDWKKNHLDLADVLGSEYDNWLLLDQDDRMYGSAADGVKKALDKDPNATIDPDDQMAARNWVNAISRKYILMANHTGTPATPKSAPPAAPGASPAAQAPQEASKTPLIVGIGAAAVFGLILIASARG
jgi:hypothetical protein